MARGARSVLTGTLLVGAVALTACSSTSPDDARSDAIRVVASTNVYGDIAKRIGGDRVDVTSIIDDPSQDPHSYEASTRTKLAVSRASVVIVNGGGYDDFVNKLVPEGDIPVLDAVYIAAGNKAESGGEFNEHVWYDFAAMTKLADRIAGAFADSRPAERSFFDTNAATFKASLATLIATEKRIASAHGGDGVAITEPVPLYLLAACGLVNKTPAKFSEAVEEGEDVPVGVLNETLQLFANKTVKLLAYNEQTSGPETEKVEQAAKRHGVAVVPVTETLPAGTSYLSWMAGNVNAVRDALD